MNVSSIIAEFNPLHNSHKYILDTAKDGCDILAVILGGNFMQRGEVSVMDCYDRAKMAVSSGADIVLLLPYAFSAQTAEVFAWGGVSIADKIGSTKLIFGSEDSSLPFLKTAELLNKEPEKYRNILRQNLDHGMSFALSREDAVRTILGEEAAKCLKGANNILSTEYTKAIIRRKSPISPVSVERIKNTLSATDIRKMIANYGVSSVKDSLPKESYHILSSGKTHFQRDYDEFLYHSILILGKEHLKDTAEMEDGLSNRIYDNRYLITNGMENFCSAVSTKRYTKSRIRRILYNSVMHYSASHLQKAKEHDIKNIIALCANKKGREFIKYVNEKGDAHIISNLSKSYSDLYDDKWIYDMEIRAYEIYHKDEQLSLLKKHCIVV